MMEKDDKLNNLLKNKMQDDKALILELQGEVDLNYSVELRGLLLEALEAGPPALLLDLQEVGFMDSSGLATLVEILKLSRQRQIPFKLSGLQPRVKSVFEIARLDQLFDIFTDRQEALA